MRIPSFALFPVAALGIVVACSSSSGRTVFTETDDAGGQPPGSFEIEGGTPTTPSVPVTVTGTVFAPNGTLPLAKTLVYVTTKQPDPIPTKGAYCDTCVTLDQGTFVESSADGTFSIATQLPEGKAFIVTQKGQFRRVREITVPAGGGDITVDEDDTTLPKRSRPADGDDVPKMVILKDDYDFDKIDESLTKLGLDNVEIRNDHTLLEDETDLLDYQIVFVPCGDNEDPLSADPKVKANVQKFVQAGGKLYVTDWSYEFVRQPFPGYITWTNETKDLGSATNGISQWKGAAAAEDQGLADWLAATGDATFEAEGNYTAIRGVNTQQGLDHAGNTVDITPKVWMQAKRDGKMIPTTVSFEQQCGRVLFSSYHTENDGFGGSVSTLRAQEKSLLYILLEVGVCVGDRPTVQ